MLCANCRRSLQARLPLFRNHLPLPLLTRRSIATAPATPNAAPTHPPPPSATSSHPAASSTPSSGGSSSPPSSTSTPTNTTAGTGGSKTRVKEKVRSSVAGGAVLQGLGYTKAKPQIIAKEDEEYPEWLWGILNEDAAVGGEGAIGMLFYGSSFFTLSLGSLGRVRSRPDQTRIQRSIPSLPSATSLPFRTTLHPLLPSFLPSSLPPSPR
jgi:hypothetical protein